MSPLLFLLVHLEPRQAPTEAELAQAPCYKSSLPFFRSQEGPATVRLLGYMQKTIPCSFNGTIVLELDPLGLVTWRFMVLGH